MKLKIIKNPDKEFYEKISKAVEENGQYCPCLIERSEDTKCICKDFKFQDIVGKCHCGRYVKVPEYYTEEELQNILEKK
jgi:hypothetical protein